MLANEIRDQLVPRGLQRVLRIRVELARQSHWRLMPTPLGLRSSTKWRRVRYQEESLMSSWQLVPGFS